VCLLLYGFCANFWSCSIISILEQTLCQNKKLTQVVLYQSVTNDEKRAVCQNGSPAERAKKLKIEN
jgi:hypothetical protein